MAKTSDVATGFHGDKLYQQRARMILPILVRQAEAGKPIFYADLAQEVGMSNPRNLNYPLGCIGDALNDLAAEWDREIPHIQSIVVNQQSDSPGPGFDGFLAEQGYTWRNARDRKAVLEEYRTKVSAYPDWTDVLEALGVERARSDISDTLGKAARFRGGEGPEHQALKEFVRVHPEVVGLAADHPAGEVEHLLPSGDRIDVLFTRGKRVTAVEVKPSASSEADVARGLFQCVKYRAVLEAESRYWQSGAEIEVKLVLGGELPVRLVPLRNSLGVKVIEGVMAKHGG